MKISNKSTTKTRLLDFLTITGIKKPDFYKKTGLGNGFLDKNDNINSDKVEIIISNYPDLNLTWLITGKGEMLKNVEKSDIQFYDPENKPTGRKLIPFYDTTAAAGTLQVSNMDSVAEPAEYIDAGDWFLDADSAMRVHGDSMFPEYKSGSIVVMREVFDKRLIVYGEDYMIQTNEYKAIKRLMQSGEKGCWLACSVNDEIWEVGPLKGRLVYEPFPIFIDDVTKICRILGCVKRTESSRIVYNKNKRI